MKPETWPPTDTWTPLDGPVVPDVYIMVAKSDRVGTTSLCGSGPGKQKRAQRDWRGVAQGLPGPELSQPTHQDNRFDRLKALN